MLDALWSRGPDGNIRPSQHHYSCGQRGALTTGQEQHCHQPSHLYIHEQTGESAMGQLDMYDSFIYTVKKDKLQQLKSYKWSI